MAKKPRKPKEKKPPKIVRKLRDESQVLHFAYGPEGARLYWLEPSGKKVTEGAALRAISFPGVAPLGDALFGGLDQSYVWGGAA